MKKRVRIGLATFAIVCGLGFGAERAFAWCHITNWFCSGEGMIGVRYSCYNEGYDFKTLYYRDVTC